MGDGRGVDGMFGREYRMPRRGRARHVEFPERSFVLRELPLVQEAESAHAEGKYRGYGWCGGEEGRRAENCTIAAKRCSQVDLFGE